MSKSAGAVMLCLSAAGAPAPLALTRPMPPPADTCHLQAATCPRKHRAISMLSDRDETHPANAMHYMPGCASSSSGGGALVRLRAATSVTELRLVFARGARPPKHFAPSTITWPAVMEPRALASIAAAAAADGEVIAREARTPGTTAKTLSRGLGTERRALGRPCDSDHAKRARAEVRAAANKGLPGATAG